MSVGDDQVCFPKNARPADHLIKAFQWDLARQVERLDFLMRWLPRYAEWGYQELYVHLEDAVEYPSLPHVARPDAYTYGQFSRLVDAASAAGLRVVPIVNLLGHTQYLVKVPALRDLNELRDPAGRPLEHGQICPLHPRTLEVAARILRDMAPFCTAGKVHVGLDESFQLGRCPRCRAEIARVGLAGHFSAHVNRLHRLARSLGLRLGLWADMLALLPAAIPELPRDVIAYDWYYYPFTRHPRVELRNFAEVDLAAPLRARGIEYWGCPMNGAFRHEPLPVFGERLANILSWWRRCRRVGAGGLLVTSWEANRLALELTTVVDAAAACLWLNPGIEDPQEMLARGFARVFGGGSASLPDFAKASSWPVPVSGPRRSSKSEGGRPAYPESRRDACATRKAGPPDAAVLNRDGGVRRPLPALMAGWRRWARAALASDKCAFAGYHRWQINDRWDVCAGRDGPAHYEKEARWLGQVCRSLPSGSAASTCAKATVNRLAKEDAGDLVAEPLPAPRGTGGRAATGGYPPALAASLAFRVYLARRDVFVRRAARAVFQLRRELVRGAVPQPALRGGPGLLTHDSSHMDQEDHATQRGLKHRATLNQLRHEAAEFAAALRAGRAAARAMWARSRDPRDHGPNERMLARDAERLREWRHWLRRAERSPAIVWRATPVCGAWQLQFTVHNFAPALQKIVVEQRRPDGAWVPLHSCHSIEFRAFAAHPQTKISREFSVPVAGPLSAPTPADGRRNAPLRSPAMAGPGQPSQPAGTGSRAATSRFPCLRLAVRGVGQIAVSDAELTNGVVTLRARGWPQRRKQTLGRPAPRRGFPQIPGARPSRVTLTFTS